MVVSILLVIVGLGLVVFGADFLVEGASGIARKVGISEFVIGLTIVGFGTSCPELVVSINGAIAGNSDISIGNVIGSNVFNSLVIIGIVSILSTMGITPTNKKRDIPIVIAASVLLIILGKKNTLFGIGHSDMMSRIECILFLILFAAYIWMCFKTDDKSSVTAEDPQKQRGIAVSILITTVGLAALVFGGDLFVDSAVSLAKSLGVSDKFIAITLLAGGTSLPELATCVVAAVKKRGQLAIGNILGSNIFNILLILGVAGTINPLDFSQINMIDLGAMLLGSILIFTAAYTGKKDKLDYVDGAIMLLAEAAYMTWLICSMNI